MPLYIASIYGRIRYQIKEDKTMIVAMVEYINKYGRISMKAFCTMEAANAFVKRLEERGCDYLLTLM